MTSPITYQFPGCPGGNSTSKKLAVKIERRLLALKLDMEVWRLRSDYLVQSLNHLR